MKRGLRNFVRAAAKTARLYARDKKKTEHLLDEAQRKARREKGLLGEFAEELGSLFRMLRAWARGRYTVVPWKTIVMALAAVIYFVNPLDLVPDFMPAIGLVDDATVIAMVIRAIRKDVVKYLEWEEGGRWQGEESG